MRLLKVILLIPCLFFIGCTSHKNIGEFDETLTQDYQPYDEELWVLEKAKELHSEAEAKGLLYSDAMYQDFLDAAKRSLLNEHPALKESTQLYFVRSIDVNAFALPNGNIYLNSGLVATLPNHEELVAIIAHELAHVQKRHSLKAVISQKNTLIGAHVADMLLLGIGLPYFGALASITSFSRDQETEADLYAINLLNSSNYNANNLLYAFEEMQKNPRLKHVKHSVYSTHPSFANRLNTLTSEIEHNALQFSKHEQNHNHDALRFTYKKIRESLIQDVIRAQLRERLYFLTLTLLETRDTAQFDAAQLALSDFYFAECYSGIYYHPEIAAKEKYWLDTGKRKLDKKTLEEVNNEREEHLSLAIEYYQKALASDVDGYVKAYKKLGELYEASGASELAINNYNAYLAAAPDALDARQVKIKLSRIKTSY